MKKFEELDKRSVAVVEEETLKRWGGVKAIYDESVELNKNNKRRTNNCYWYSRRNSE